MFPKQPGPNGNEQQIPKSAIGLLAAAGAFVLLVIIAFVALHFLRPSSSAKGMGGDFLQAVAVPGPEGGYRLWILTDGSFHYIKSVQSPGRRSVGRECKFCKTWLYVYDPVGKAVLAKFKTDYKALILHAWMTSSNGRVWVASGAYDRNEPRIFVYGTEPPALIAQTPDIIAQHPELASGLIDLRMQKDPDRIVLNTRDGRTGLVLTLSDDKFYASETEYRSAMARSDEDTVTVFALGQEDSGPRKRLYKVTGPKGRVASRSLEFFLRDAESLWVSDKATAEPATPGRVYIEGVILCQDADGCLILHQDAAGSKADRLLTCVNGAGKEKWTTTPEELFKEMSVDTNKDPMSAIFFMKSKLDASRLAGLVLLQLQGVGVIGFDFESGRKLWELKF